MNLYRNLVGTFALLGVLLVGYPAYAFDYFVGIDGASATVDIAEIKYKPVIKNIRAGVFVKNGIALQAILGSSQKADEEINIEADIESIAGVSVRLQSPDEGLLNAYVDLGYNVIDLNVSSETVTDVLGEEELESPFAMAGFQKRIKFFPMVSYFGQYGLFFRDDNIKMTSFSFGYQINF